MSIINGNAQRWHIDVTMGGNLSPKADIAGDWVKFEDYIAKLHENNAEINRLRQNLKVVAMATEPGALYENRALHNIADQALLARGEPQETVVAEAGFVSDELFVIARDRPMSANTRTRLQALCPRIGALETIAMQRAQSSAGVAHEEKG